MKKKTRQKVAIKKTTKPKHKQVIGISLKGEKNLKFTLAKCCLPVPGDDIMAIVVPAKGLSIHRKDCVNLTTVLKNSKEKVLDVEWDTDENSQITYLCTMTIRGYDRKGLLQDLLEIIYNANVNLREVKTKVNKDNTRMSATITVDLSNIRQFYDLKRRFYDIEDVFSVSRVNLGLES